MRVRCAMISAWAALSASSALRARSRQDASLSASRAARSRARRVPCWAAASVRAALACGLSYRKVRDTPERRLTAATVTVCRSNTRLG